MNTQYIEENVWYVYQHLFPNKKMYFGIAKGDPKKRWNNGLGYRTQTVMFRAIIAYGWNNIEHNIIKENLSVSEAQKLEIELIAKHRTNIQEHGHKANGYNMTPGGEVPSWLFMNSESSYREVMKEKCWEPNSIKVDCYKLDGSFVKTFDSMRAAGIELKIDPGSISKCIKGKANRAGQYKFSKHDEDIPISECKKEITKKVKIFDFQGNYLMEFNSCTDASKYVLFGSTKGSSIIAKCAKGERASYKGFLWSYDESPVLFASRKPTRETPVKMYDLNGKFIKSFNSIKSAKKYVKPETKSTSAIKQCLDGKLKQAYGYKWKYA